ncbi:MULTISPECIES: PqqD family protein [unclassified Sphingomonas]|uniref:PqqD family protein n=1 Tax=unclassified Sphingomonas TaxID=196159 RepID=UPI0008330D4F|nr:MULTISPECIES: PqqD family protein [unclassified Sphingomonas]
MTDAKWTRNDDWVGTAIEDSFVMVNIGNGSYVALNETARAIWEVLDAPRTQAEIEASLRAQFDVTPDACTAAVTRTLADMEVQQLAHVA